MKLDSSIVNALSEIESKRGISRERLQRALKEAFRSAWEQEHGETPNLQIAMDLQRSSPTVEGYLEKEVVEEVEDESLQISLKEAKEISREAEVGDAVLLEVDLSEFGFLAVDNFRNSLQSLLRDEEREQIFEEYKDRVYDLFNVKVLYRDRGDVFVEVNGQHEGIIPNDEQIPTERYENGDRLKVILLDVRQNRSPILVFSRSHSELIRRLFENEVPEVNEGDIELVAIARDPGYRAKVAVRSKIPEIDPVGTCIGTKGIRVTAVSSEIAGEKIDLCQWKEDPFEMIAEALSPAEVFSVELFDDENRAEVIVPDDQIALAIGRSWRNVKLASRLTKYRIEVESMSEAGIEVSYEEEEEEELEGELAEEEIEGELPDEDLDEEALDEAIEEERAEEEAVEAELEGEDTETTADDGEEALDDAGEEEATDEVESEEVNGSSAEEDEADLTGDEPDEVVDAVEESNGEPAAGEDQEAERKAESSQTEAAGTSEED